MANNDYDRILRENIQEIFIPYVERMLEIEIVSSKALPTKLTGTLENEVDYLVKAMSGSGDEFLLHFEFQTNNDPTMLKRIKRYHGFIYYKYGLPIHHFVIYTGAKKATMDTTLKKDDVFKGFHLIQIADHKLEEFLSASNPEEVLMGILSDFGSLEASESIQKIINALEATSKDEVQLKRHLQQLKILARLRNLDTDVQEKVNEMPLKFNIRDSRDFQLGVKEGVIEGREEGIKAGRLEAIVQLASSGIISIESAAATLGISIEEMSQHIGEVKKGSGHSK